MEAHAAVTVLDRFVVIIGENVRVRVRGRVRLRVRGRVRVGGRVRIRFSVRVWKVTPQ
jgi:hypothetical protein